MDFVGYKYVATLVVIAEILVLLLAWKRNPKLAICAVLLSLMVKGQYLWFGRPIYAWQIASLFGLIYLTAGKAYPAALRPGRALGRFRLSMLWYFIYTFSISIPMWLLFAAEGLGDVATEVSISRVLTQIGYFLFVVGLYGLGIWAGRHFTTFALLRSVILISTIAAYGAIFQALVMLVLGVNIFPIIGSDNIVHSAYILDLAFRANSFVGEPKHLGILMSFGLISCFITRLFTILPRRRFGFHQPLVMIVALLLSLSTTGIALTAGGIGALAVMFFHRLRSSDIVVAGFTALILATQVIDTGSDFSEALERQTSKTEFEVQDESVKEGLLANPSLIPTGTGLGNVHLIAVDYLPANFPLFRDGGYKANSGLFFVIGDSGLVGLLLLFSGPMFATASVTPIRRRLRTSQRKEALSAVALVWVSLLSFMMRYDVSYFFYSGLIFARLAYIRTEAVKINSAEHPHSK